MRVLVLGAGMMGRAIAYDLQKFSQFDRIFVGENDTQTRRTATRFFQDTPVDVICVDAQRNSEVKKHLRKVDIAISALPYVYNFKLATLAIETHTHFIDLGGNNTIVQKERGLFSKARKNKVTIIPDSGLAPGLVSIITHDIVNCFDSVDFVKIRVGGLPRYPQPPLNYQIVFSPYGLINEYVEDAIVLEGGKICSKKSMTGIETIKFPKPFGSMEAFFTSGGCSTLPFTYKDKIRDLNYKTIRYIGHCEMFKVILDLGFAEEQKIQCCGSTISPRDVLASLLMKNVPTTGEDVVLLKVRAKGEKQGKKRFREYMLMDYYDQKKDITAMMRTTGYPASITAQMIESEAINKRGVFCPEEIIQPRLFFAELKKRNIILSIRERSVST